MYRNIANIDAESANATIDAPPNVGLPKRLRSSIGSGRARSSRKKATSRTKDPLSSPTICALDQPWSLPRTSAKMSMKRAAEKVISPGQSIRAAWPRTLTSRVEVKNSAASPIGRLR